MGNRKNNEVKPYAVQIENILSVMSGECFGKDLSAKIVGGTKRLEVLIASGAVEATKPTNAQNGKWYCNAAQVLQHCRDMRKKKR